MWLPGLNANLSLAHGSFLIGMLYLLSNGKYRKGILSCMQSNKK
jgi:hypothetical protein